MIAHVAINSRALLLKSSVLFAFAVLPLCAQWTKLPTDGIPRTADGKINMTAPAPRMADGKPDLTGIWNPLNTKYLNDLAADYKPGELPIQPWAEAFVKQRSDSSHGAEESDANCLPPGIPKINAAPNPIKIVQEPKLLCCFMRRSTCTAKFSMDGREPRKDTNPSWLGYSTANGTATLSWWIPSDTTASSWLDKVGHPITESHARDRTLPPPRFRPP